MSVDLSQTLIIESDIDDSQMYGNYVIIQNSPWVTEEIKIKFKILEQYFKYLRKLCVMQLKLSLEKNLQY